VHCTTLRRLGTSHPDPCAVTSRMSRPSTSITSASPTSGGAAAGPSALVPIKTLHKEHALRRVQLELLLETTPRDSRYSSELVEMMKREETLLGDGQAVSSTSAATKDLISKIERALADETSRYFARVSALNNKRWVGLMQTLERERERLKMEYFDKSTRLPEPVPIVPLQPNFFDSVTESDLEAESARLEESYNRNWLMYEGFHLNEAFQSQFQRVEKDWSVHETALKDDFQTKRRQIVGPDLHDSSDTGRGGNTSAGGDNNGYDARWQHPEKQKTLIHTAPVLAPTNNNSGSGRPNTVGGGKARGARSKEDSAEVRICVSVHDCVLPAYMLLLQLDRLERQLNSQLEALQRQKENAHRWMHRQKARLCL
jgi:hypothetical protein